MSSGASSWSFDASSGDGMWYGVLPSLIGMCVYTRSWSDIRYVYNDSVCILSVVVLHKK